VPDLAEQLLDARARGATAHVRQIAGLAGPAVQQRVELAAAAVGELVGEQLFDTAMRVSARGRDHPRERVDRRAQHAARTEMLTCEIDQGCRRVVLDGALG